MTEDERHLKLLSIFHYVVAGLAGLFACIPILHLAIGIAFIVAPHKFTDDGELPPAWFGWIFVILASTLIAVGWVFAGFVFVREPENAVIPFEKKPEQDASAHIAG